jgi:mono/diheme cytochrome c family protein
MGLRSIVLVSFLGCIGLSSASPAADSPKEDAPASPTAAAPVTFTQHIAPFVSKYCLGCHSGPRPKGRFGLEGYKDDAAVAKERVVWDRIAHMIRAQEMPPSFRPQPTPVERDLVTTWISGELAKVDCTGRQDPGRITIRRLNRTEYNNTIRDLVGVPFQPADDFPSDDVGYGFDNIGDVLSLPPILMEKYLAAAEKIVDLAFKTPDARQRILICQPTETTKTECARKILQSFTSRAFRRPAGEEEVNRLMRLVDLAQKEGDGFEVGIQLAVQAVLVSPHFLFRIEQDRRPLPARTAIQPIGEYALASRLSYFLWSSLPDEELFALAKDEKLRQAGNLEAQVRRMLRDPKAKALVENFGGQWLQTRNLKAATPDPELFPNFDEALRDAMRQETELFFEAIMKEDRSILDFLDADYTFVNERLARHYGIPGIQGPQFHRVSLSDGQRGGVLTQASVLLVTSNPTRTSPVKRGKWILENLLGTPPPPPPPDAGELEESKDAVLSGSLRQRMEMHRKNPNCATCHQRMDPLGFSLENFDAIGAWRGRDGKFDIDASGILPNGQSFNGPKELKVVLKTKEEDFRRCLTEKMLTYALGRGLEHYDKCAVDSIVKALAKDQDKFATLVLEIVKSDPFQMRRGRRE